MKLIYILLACAILVVAGCTGSKTEQTAGESLDCGQYKTQNAKDFCLIISGLVKKDASVCQYTKNQNCYRTLWAELENESVCLNVDDEVLRNECYRSVAAAK